MHPYNIEKSIKGLNFWPFILVKYMYLRQGLQSYRPASIFLKQSCTCNITEIKFSHFDMHFFI